PRGVPAGPGPPRMLVPASSFEALAALIEVMGEERRVRPGRRTVDGEQGSRDGGVGFPTAIQKLRAIGDLLRERMPEGVLTRRLGGTEELGAGQAIERRRELNPGHIDHRPQPATPPV